MIHTRQRHTQRQIQRHPHKDRHNLCHTRPLKTWSLAPSATSAESVTLSGTGPHGGSPENESAGGWAAHRERERARGPARPQQENRPTSGKYHLGTWKQRVIIERINFMAQKMVTASTTELLLDLCAFSLETWGH